ncbi:hypothetical protein JOF36_001563 [Pseudonocardia parietis]|uniref:Uncharacterized protein n=1 Tax=Pseudonocardia parietis TaxID=570936 RepID=A0ABS4VPL7_9PSEU|nr:hypothetical protein [Pseudonocardia parietis]MBP2365867.1 hypothetical protein [Pseudonocardia parietis]
MLGGDGVKRRAEGVGCGVRGLHGEVAVQLGGGREFAVPQDLGHQSQRHPVGDHQSGGQVPQVVQSDPTQAGRLRQCVEGVEDSLRAQRLPVLPGEYQVAVLVRVGPQRALGQLRSLVRAQCRGDPGREAHAGRGALGLRGAEPDVPVDVGHRAAHVQDAPVQVDVAPSQREGFAAAQPTPDQHLEERGEAVVGRVVEEGDRLGR